MRNAGADYDMQMPKKKRIKHDKTDEPRILRAKSKSMQPQNSSTTGENVRSRHSASKRVSAKGKRGATVELLSSRLAYQGPLFDVYKDYVREPGGKPARRDVIRHSGSVVVLAVDDSQNPNDPLIILERQYRHAAGRYMWEIPAGRKEPEEEPLVGAKRELLEETGFRARRWSKLAMIYVSPGFLAEWMQIYVAEGLTAGETKPDEDEYIECRQIPLSQALEWVESGKIIDAKSIVALLKYDRLRSARRQP